MEKTSEAESGNGMAPNRYDRTRNGKAKIPRRRNPAERKIIWQSLKERTNERPDENIRNTA